MTTTPKNPSGGVLPSVAFVNPSVGFSDRRKSKPIGLAYIMAFLAEHGFSSKGFDFGDSEDDAIFLAETYGLDQFDVVGFSVYNESFLQAIRMAEWVRSKRPDALIVFGGPHATAVHEHVVTKYAVVDCVVRREGEEPMLELLSRFGDRAAQRTVAGTTWRDPNGGPPIVNAERAFVKDLDQLPYPDAEFVSHSGYPESTYFDEVQGVLKPALTICSSRSCPYDCSFCGVLTIGRKYRSRDAERVVDELFYFRKRDGKNYSHVYFSDANFFVSPMRALAIARALHEADPTVSFSFGTRVNQILRAKHVLPELKACGLRFIELGIESASPAVLTRLAKHVPPQMNVAAVRLLKQLGIEVSIDFIMLDPASTLDDVEANLHFLRDNGFYDYVPHDHLYTSLVLYEGTPIRKFYEERYGVTFDPDLLPSSAELFEIPEVMRFSAELRRFRREYQGRIDDVLALVEIATNELAHQDDVCDESLARLQLDAVSLRHAPNLFFANLLADAKTGFRLLDAKGFSALLPTVGRGAVSLPVLLARAESSARAFGTFDAPVMSGTGRDAQRNESYSSR